MEFGECQSCVSGSMGLESAYREGRHSPDRSTSRIKKGPTWTKQDHIRPSVERDSRQFGPQNLLSRLDVPNRAEAEVARAADVVPRGPDVRTRASGV